MKKLLLLTAIAVTVFACGDKPEVETDINYLKRNVFSRSIYYGPEPYKLYFIDDNTVNMYYRPIPYYNDSVTYPDDSVIHLTYIIYETTRDTLQSFYIGFSDNEQLIFDTVWDGRLYLSGKRKDELRLYGKWEIYIYDKQ
jgi:hypothetical protein